MKRLFYIFLILLYCSPLWASTLSTCQGSYDLGAYEYGSKTIIP